VKNSIHPVRAERLRQGLTQPQLAARAGLSRFTITRLETGKHQPTRAVKTVLAIALGVTPAELFPRG
jgi:transcriptional regulator with XRE-family HTH domain